MITFDYPQGRFMHRTVAVILDQERLLIHQAEGDAYWALPGGRVEFGESAAVGLVREMQEELLVTVRLTRLLWLVENFFVDRGRRFHELGLYFLAELPPDSELRQRAAPWSGCEPGTTLVFRWLPLAELADFPLVPAFLRTRMDTLPHEIEHVVVGEKRRPGERETGKPGERETGRTGNR